MFATVSMLGNSAQSGCERKGKISSSEAFLCQILRCNSTLDRTSSSCSSWSGSLLDVVCSAMKQSLVSLAIPSLSSLLVYTFRLLINAPFRSFTLHCRKQSIMKWRLLTYPRFNNLAMLWWSALLHGASFAMKCSTCNHYTWMNCSLKSSLFPITAAYSQCSIIGIWTLFILLIVPRYNSSLMSQSLNQVHPTASI